MRLVTSLAVLTALMWSAPQPQAQASGNCQLGSASAILEANQVRAGLYNKGNLFWNGGNPLYEVPAGSGIHAMFASGLWVGGVVDGELRMAAATYAQGDENYEFWPGPLNEDGSLPNPDDCSAFDRIWTVTRDELIDYVLNGTVTEDLEAWPVGLGAPTCIDENENAECEPDELQVEVASRDQVIDLEASELPDLRGAEQGAFWVMNDVGNAHLTTGSAPIGLEVRAFAYAYDEAPLATTTFYDYELHYRGNEPLEETFFAFWADPDLGNFNDDYIGSAPELGLGFVYNADNNDEGSAGGYGTPPPALGVDFLRGPLTDVDGDGIPDTLGMTKFGYYNNTTDLRTGNPDTVEDFYNYMSGFWRDGTPWTEGGDGSDLGGAPVNFVYPNSGTPGSPTPGYWSEVCPTPDCGTSIPPGDRRFVMSSGPFTIEPGEVQALTFGIVWAQGEDNFDSIQAVKLLDEEVQAFFDGDFTVDAEADATPRAFGLAGSYPNPFAVRTTLPLTLAEAGHVRVEVFDVLGRRVDVLLDAVMTAGTHPVTWAPPASQPSGVYVVRVTAQAGVATTSVVLQR